MKVEIDKNDITGLYNAVLRSLGDKPVGQFEKALVGAVLSKNNIDLSRKPKVADALLELVHKKGIPLTASQPEDAILSFHRRVVADGQLPEAVEKFAERKEIPSTRLTADVKASMVAYLRTLGVTIDPTKVDNGIYDEYFALAYEKSSTGRDGKSDPILLSRPQGFVSPWDFEVDTFDTADEQGVIVENILAAGALDYVYYLGEVLGVYRLADALVLNWAAGTLDIADTDTSQKLYRYWKVREDRMSPEERGMLYKRVLNKGDADVLSKMVVNESFPTLWDKLMQEVAVYVEATVDAASDTSVSKVPIQRATQELQYNLTEFMTGMGHMQVTEMYAQLKEAFELLGAPEVVAQLSGGRRKNVWAVIAYVSRQEIGAVPDVSAVRTLAVDGNRVFRWIADFAPGAPDDAAFEEFKDAAEGRILAAASVADYTPPGAEPEDAEDEFGDDFADVDSEWDA
jgi:hypothetical protein